MPLFRLPGTSGLRRAAFGQDLPFPDRENPADTGFLIGDYRPEHDLPDVSGKVLKQQFWPYRTHANGEPKAAAISTCFINYWHSAARAMRTSFIV
jgi:hypothetical protein